jgi:hypothetical protein
MIARVLAAPAIGFASAPANTIRDNARRRRSPGREGRERSMPTINCGQPIKPEGPLRFFQPKFRRTT